MNYTALNYNYVQKLFANVDKLSFKGHSQTVRSDLGRIRLYGFRHTKSGWRRSFSVAGSDVLHNGGGYTSKGLKRRLLAMDF